MKSVFHLRHYLSFILFLIALNAQSVFATHVENMELFYRWKSDSTYEFTAVFVRNCTGFAGAAPMQFIIRAQSNSLNIDQNFIVGSLPIFGPGVPSLQPENLYNCIDSANYLCFEEYVYRGDWVSGGMTDDWVFSTTLCCGPNLTAPTNVINGSVRIEIGLNNHDFPDGSAQNSSPFWHNRRPIHPGYLQDTVENYWMRTICAGEFLSINQNVREYQGDSIHYSFYRPQTINGNPRPTINGYTFAYPLPTLNGPLTINPITGTINVQVGQPTGTGNYVVGIQAEEFRNDTIINGPVFTVIPKRIGYVRRELQIWIADSTNCRKDSAHIKDIVLDSLPKDSTITAYFHDGISGHQNSLIRCNTLSPDGSEFIVVDSSYYVSPYDSTLRIIPVIKAWWKCETNGMTDKVHLKLSEPLTCANYSILLRVGTDLDVIESECGYWEPAGSSAEIIIDDEVSVDIGPDIEVCDDTIFYETINAGFGYESYYWNTWDTTRSITVSYANKYWVEVTNKFECKASDTMNIITIDCDTVTNDTTNNDTTNVGLRNLSDDRLLFYPNPTSGLVYLQGNLSSMDAQVIVYNMRGLQVLQEGIDLTKKEIPVDMSAFDAGVYILQLIEGGRIIQQEKVIRLPD